MNWGTRIFLAFVVFAGIIITMVVISMRQPVGLVAKDYYKQEIAYQDQIDKMQNFRILPEKPVVKVKREEGKAFLVFPEALAEEIIQGEVLFFRPSDDSSDQNFALKPEGGVQEFDLQKLQRGLWKVKFWWEDKSRGYYHEQTIVI
jgi:nitrogen fixation protein FixH